MNQVPFNVSFQRVLVGDKLTSWLNLVAKIANIQLNNMKDFFPGIYIDMVFFFSTTYVQLSYESGLPFHEYYHINAETPLEEIIFLGIFKEG